MKKHHYILGLVLILATTACSRLAVGPAHREWTEDVLLEDGKTIIVKRVVEFNETNSLSGDSYNAVETDASISFTGMLNDLPPWRQPLMALLLYLDGSTNEWVVVATTTSCEIWLVRGKPRPLYWEFRLRDGEWRDVPLSSSSIGRPVNLLHRYQNKLEKTHITIDDRKRLESNSTILRSFRSIVTDEKVNCMG